MDEDTELVARAAKSAGVDLGSWEYSFWNPLTDSGDALDLAVKLRIDILTEDDGDGIVSTLLPNGKQGPLMKTETDPYAATRRAIVMAAAELAPKD